MPVSRNKPMGIEERTIKNLRVVKDLFDQSPDTTQPAVHVVTQVVDSLLGIVHRPYDQRYALHEDIKPLKHLYAEDWGLSGPLPCQYQKRQRLWDRWLAT